MKHRAGLIALRLVKWLDNHEHSPQLDMTGTA